MDDETDTKNDEYELIYEAIDEQRTLLLKVFTERQLDTLNRAQLCNWLDIAAAFGAAEVSQKATGLTVHVAWKSKIAGLRNGWEWQDARLADIIRGLLELRLEFKKTILCATLEEAELLKSKVETLLGRRPVLPQPYLEDEQAAPANEQVDPIVAFAHAIEIVDFLRESLDILTPEGVAKIATIRSIIAERSVMERRSAIVGVVNSGLYTLGEVYEEEKDLAKAVEAAIELIFERLYEHRDLGEFGAVDPKYLEPLLQRAALGGSKAPRAPYIAAAWSICVRAFGDEAEPNEGEEEARRRISNIFRNASNAFR